MRRSERRRSVWSCALLVAMVSSGGCEPGGTGDAADARADASVDVFDADGSGLYGLCTSDAPCLAALSGAFCDLTYPGGLCTIPCVDDAVCGPHGHCLEGRCRPACTEGSGSLECDRYSAACGPLPGATNSVCVPECYVVGSPAGWHACPQNERCRYDNGACGAPPTAGTLDNGSPCTDDAACAGGRCRREVSSTGGPTGWVGGYCVSYGRAPPYDDYREGQPYPTGNCPPGSAPIFLVGVTEGDVTQCLATCNGNADCRAAYVCDHGVDRYTGAPYYANGVCVPSNCAYGDGGVYPCPAGYACHVFPSDDAGVVRGVCGPDGGGVPDGAVDAAIDG